MGGVTKAVTPPRRLLGLPTWLIGHLANRSHDVVLTAFGDAECRSEYAVLACVDEFGPLSQTELSRRIRMDTGDLVRLLRRLEDRNLLSRRLDGRDRRRNLVTITRAGGAELRRLDAVIERAQQRLLEPLDGAQRATLLECLQRLFDHHLDGTAS